MSVELRPPEVTVGDHVEAVLTLAVPVSELAGEPRFPVWQKTWGEAEIVRVDPPARGAAGSAVTFTQRLVLAGFRPGEIALPPVELVVPSSSGTSAVTTAADLALRVRSVLPAGDEKPEPKPPAPPRQLRWGRAFWWSLGAGLALGTGLAALLWRRSRPATAAAAIAPLDPLAELLARLREIAQLPADASEPAHTRLSLALRRFLGRAFAFPAAESTTTEIQRQLRSRHLPETAARRAVRLLRECDAVKFARTLAPPGALGERLDAARSVGDEVESYLRPPAAQAPLEKTA